MYVYLYYYNINIPLYPLGKEDCFLWPRNTYEFGETDQPDLFIFPKHGNQMALVNWGRKTIYKKWVSRARTRPETWDNLKKKLGARQRFQNKQKTKNKLRAENWRRKKAQKTNEKILSKHQGRNSWINGVHSWPKRNKNITA